ncbi:Ribosomal small subunit pseudouridine synthase A [Streptococcus sp. DD10]|uniref:pseudouridine synthase n=1 Tax=Streptococcus sp. DD10 TaxID=1777878 RepID=UPI00079431B0|nr:pseudouridine synthase [Streptococcus sp. DD10]KXT72350.1 Ribosomal small subunit pseudouridine synthase A [Streptococcus sp. DD10]
MRLDKFLVDCGVGSRTEVKQLLKQKKITVNGNDKLTGKFQLDPQKDQVFFRGEKLVYEEFCYYLLNKPKGVISATEDERHQTVIDLLDDRARHKEIFPVGRLDIDTHGLLLLTNNGKLAHAMLSPKKHVAKIYRAKIEGIMNQSDVDYFKEGIVLKDFTTLPAKLRILEVDHQTAMSYVEIEIAEGKFHQIKRMVAACGKKVVDLERISMGPLELDFDLKQGEWRRLTPIELDSLKQFGVSL